MWGHPLWQNDGEQEWMYILSWALNCRDSQYASRMRSTNFATDNALNLSAEIPAWRTDQASNSEPYELRVFTWQWEHAQLGPNGESDYRLSECDHQVPFTMHMYSNFHINWQFTEYNAKQNSMLLIYLKQSHSCRLIWLHKYTATEHTQCITNCLHNF